MNAEPYPDPTGEMQMSNRPFNQSARTSAASAAAALIMLVIVAIAGSVQFETIRRANEASTTALVSASAKLSWLYRCAQT